MTKKTLVLGDFIEDDEITPPDEAATYNLLREHIREVLNGLPPREVRILQLRYGLLDGQAYTLEEVGRKVGVTARARPPDRSPGPEPPAPPVHPHQTARLSGMKRAGKPGFLGVRGRVSTIQRGTKTRRPPLPGR